MEWTPTDGLYCARGSANVAAPAVSTLVPSEVCPSYSVTVPVGVQEDAGAEATVTMNVTDC